MKEPSLMTDAELREALGHARTTWRLAQDGERCASQRFDALVMESTKRPWGAARPVPGRVRGKRRKFNAGRVA